MADTISIAALIFLVVPLVSMVTALLPKSLLFTNLDRFVRGRFLIGVINFTYLKTSFAVCLNFLNFRSD